MAVLLLACLSARTLADGDGEVGWIPKDHAASQTEVMPALTSEVSGMAGSGPRSAHRVCVTNGLGHEAQAS